MKSDEYHAVLKRLPREFLLCHRRKRSNLTHSSGCYGMETDCNKDQRRLSCARGMSWKPEGVLSICRQVISAMRTCPACCPHGQRTGSLKRHFIKEVTRQGCKGILSTCRSGVWVDTFEKVKDFFLIFVLFFFETWKNIRNIIWSEVTSHIQLKTTLPGPLFFSLHVFCVYFISDT